MTSFEDKVLESVRQTDWYRQETESVSYFILGPIYAVFELMKGDVHYLGYHTLKRTRFYIDAESFTKQAKRFIGKYKADKKVLARVYRKWSDWNARLVDTVSNTRATGLKNLSNTELVRLNDKLGRLSYDYWLRRPFLDIFDPSSEVLIRNELNENNVSLSASELNDLLQPETLSYGQKYQLALLRLIRKHKNNKNPDYECEVEKIASDFFFLNCSYSSGVGLGSKQVKQDLLELGKKKDNETTFRRLINFKRAVKSKKERIYKQKRVKKGLVDFLHLFAFLTEWREERKAVSQHSFYLLDKLGKEIAKRSNIHWSRISHIPPNAVKRIPVKINVIKKYERQAKNNFFFIYDRQKKKHKYFDKKLSKELGRVLESIKESGVSGKVANNGYVVGFVKVIKGEKDFAKFKRGDILVTSMTRPEFLPLMLKAKAIITDEGGIASHAAIVSRELNIPCVIGTQTATRILRDNQRVLVDANKGVVKIV